MTDKQSLIEAEQKLSAEMEAFQRQFNVTAPGYFKDRYPDLTTIELNDKYFNLAIKFCEEVLDGKPKSKAYAEIFEVSIDKARTTSSQFHRSKWVQELILFLRPDEQSLYFGERKRIIQAGMAIIDDPRASNRDKTEAMKALQPFIKEAKIEQETIVRIETTGETISENITNQIAELASQGKMIGDDGKIIDVMVIE